MERARRPIKTPKRFDDEPFETPRKNSNLFKLQQQQLQFQLQQQQQQARLSEPAPKSAPEQTPSKNIIKVKLSTKSKTRDPPQLIKAAPSPPSPSPSAVTPQLHQQQSLTPATSQSSQSSPPPASPSAHHPPLKLQPPKLYPQKRQLKASRDRPIPPPLKVSSNASSQSLPAVPAPPKVRKQRSPSRPSPSAPQTPLNHSSIASTPTSLQQQPQIPIIRRPKIRRPRTPPAFGNFIPNVVLPFWDARTAAEEHEEDNVKELVHCQCGISEELGMIIQCETCFTWQHGHCLGIDNEEEVRDGYTCQACSDPKFARESMRYAYDQEWLLKGRMKRFACNRDKNNEKSVESLQKINRLIDHALKIHQLKHSLKVKSRLLRVAGDEDPELKLFRNPWPVNYQHIDGSQFVPSVNHMTSCTPALSLSAMTETPDPGYLPVETVAEASLPDIGQLEDVSAILDNTDIPNSGAISLQRIEPEQEATTPDGFRANLRLHIQQTEEFINLELANINGQLEQLQKDNLSETDGNFYTSFQSLKNDLNAIRNYIASTKKVD